MRLLIRLAATLVVVPATFYFVYWVPFSLLPFRNNRAIPFVVSLLCALGVGWSVWKKLEFAYTGKLEFKPKPLLPSILLGAVILGAIGFCGGFFGPIIFDPGANQGPLLGIFITGPLGFLLGGLGGFFYWLATIKKKTET